MSNLVWKRLSRLLEGTGKANVSIQDARPGGMSQPCFRQVKFMKRKQLIFFVCFLMSAKREVLMPSKITEIYCH